MATIGDRYENPKIPEEELLKWFTWSKNSDNQPQGVFSHETALSIHGLNESLPHLIHMTVPLDFATSAPIPSNLQVHRYNLNESEIREARGVLVTTPAVTIEQLERAGNMSREALKEIVQQGIASGVVSMLALMVRAKVAGNDRFHKLLQDMLNGAF